MPEEETELPALTLTCARLRDRLYDHVLLLRGKRNLDVLAQVSAILFGDDDEDVEVLKAEIAKERPKFEPFRDEAAEEAVGLGVDVALFDAIMYCQDSAEVVDTIRRGTGPGADRLRAWLEVKTGSTPVDEEKPPKRSKNGKANKRRSVAK